MKHDVTDLRVVRPQAYRHGILSGHLRAFHGRVCSEDDSLSRLEREHKAMHAQKEKR